MIHKRILVIIFSIMLLNIGVYVINDQYNQEDAEDYELNVAVTIPPQKEFVEEIGGDNVKVTLMVPPGQDPHSYEPETRQMRELAKADIYFKVGSGLEFEKTWMSTMKEYNPDMKIVDGSNGIQLLTMDNHEADDGHEHDEDVDPHIWLSPKNAIKMVDNLVNGLIEKDSDNEEFYKENAEDYKNKLSELDSELKEGLSQYKQREFLVYHPSFGYLENEYNLTQIPIQEQGKQPGTKGLENIIAQAKENNISVIFVSPQFDDSNANTIAEEIDGEVVKLNPLAEDYLDNMRKLKEKLISGFERREE
ncbi:MAG: metal ABC transporter solute-binding protein, Zn/Mn family [Thermoplasmatota archaeon]